MKKAIICKSALETQKVAKSIAKEILLSKRNRQKALVIALMGDLGGGKTTFIKGFAKGLGIKEKVLSPTFVILKKFSIFNSRFSIFYHIDCYRLDSPQELFNLGFQEIISSPQNIVAIEWAEKVKRILPKDTIWLKFEFINQNTRKIIFRSKDRPFVLK